MDLGLAIAGVICLAMAFGHTAIGVVWVLPSLTEERVPTTPFGSASMTVSMIRVTWYIVTVFVLAVAVLLLMLAWDVEVGIRTLVLRWLAATWLAAFAMTMVVVVRRGLRRPSQLLRLPVPLLWLVVAVLCWRAST